MEHDWILGMHISWWVFWILLTILAVAFLERKPNKHVRKKREDPLEILKRRYAAGEIDTEEFELRRSRLETQRQSDDRT
ncbi:MAG: SHOCT domain-containing protein [Aridibacter famidurans]|nr:SHOCT domain-containing protein [Aridibacter famidurans]